MTSGNKTLRISENRGLKRIFVNQQVPGGHRMVLNGKFHNRILR
jgi:hypothetical protein